MKAPALTTAAQLAEYFSHTPPKIIGKPRNKATDQTIDDGESLAAQAKYGIDRSGNPLSVTSLMDRDAVCDELNSGFQDFENDLAIDGITINFGAI